jgi:hypothetical protein
MNTIRKLWQAYRRTWSRDWLEVMVKEPELARPQYIFFTANSLLGALLFGLMEPLAAIVFIGLSIGSGLMVFFPGLRPGIWRSALERWLTYALLAAFLVVWMVALVLNSVVVASVLGGLMIVMPLLYAVAFPRDRGEAKSA